MKHLNLSALDVVPVFEGQSVKQAIDRSVEVARGLEDLGYGRFLIAEHHNTLGSASSANDIIIAYILERTSTIQVGAGGVMLPNHTPLQVAETYGTLDALFPGRVDLGFGRAPGTDPATSSLIARKNYASLEEFVQDIFSILHWFQPVEKQGRISNFPGAGAKVHPIILGSSLSSAYAAAALGLPYAFAAHINPADTVQAIETYRREFRPSGYLKAPYVILSVWLYAGSTEEEAEQRFEVSAKKLLETLQGQKESDGQPLTSAEKILMTQRMGTRLKGTVSQIRGQFEKLDALVHPDELMGVATAAEADDILSMYRILKEAVIPAE